MSDAVEHDGERLGGPRQRLPWLLRPAASQLARLERGSLDVTLPDGRKVRLDGAAPGPHGSIVVRRRRAVLQALLRGDVGLGEGYAAGDWDSPDPAAVLTVFAANSAASHRAFDAVAPLRALFALLELGRLNTRRGARRNIAAHYDLGNDFYRLWLDPTMTYSSALFEEGVADLEGAQRAKYRALLDAAGIGPGDRVLEIGCGWGGFATFAAETTGCHVTALTLSRAQEDHVRRLAAERGLSGHVDVRRRDYRDEAGRYDRIVSIEMFEAVGEQYWPCYYETLARCLRPGGTAGLQIITIADGFFESYRRGTDFIRKHIFPGGLLPPPKRLRALADANGLALNSQRAFGADYARTLGMWRERFVAARDSVLSLGFDEHFVRTWLFYLDFCIAGFRTGLTDVEQIVYRRR